MTLTEQLEAVFQRHDHQYPSSKAWHQAVIANLVAIWPKPDRKQLEERLNWLQSPHALNIREGNWEQFLDSIMAWATQPTPPITWCEHLEFRDNTSPAYREWIVKSQTFPDGKVSPTWVLHDGSYCPICGVKKPEEQL